MTPGNPRDLRITAAAGTELAVPSSGGTIRSRAPNPDPLSLPTAVYTPKSFFPHAVSLGQAFTHCPKFPPAASRRSPVRVSVPVRLAVLSDQLPVIGLVSHYLTNYLMGHKPIPRQKRRVSPP